MNNKEKQALAEIKEKLKTSYIPHSQLRKIIKEEFSSEFYHALAEIGDDKDDGFYQVGVAHRQVLSEFI